MQLFYQEGYCYTTEVERSGICTIPYSIGGKKFEQVLCDQGLGVSLMPLTLVNRQGLQFDL